MTGAAVREAIKNGAVPLIPLGSLEVHGRHLPLGTDTLIPMKILELLEEKMPGALILPAIPYGACDSQVEFPGTVSLGVKVLEKVLLALTGALYDLGARKMAALNGHGGNSDALDRIGLSLARRGAQLVQLNWWRFVWDINPSWTGGHGGGQETAGVMAVHEALVNRAAYAPSNPQGIAPFMPAAGWDEVLFHGVKVRVPRPDRRVTENGWLGPDAPEAASKAWGDEMLRAAADYAADFLNTYSKTEGPT